MKFPWVKVLITDSKVSPKKTHRNAACNFQRERIEIMSLSENVWQLFSFEPAGNSQKEKAMHRNR